MHAEHHEDNPHVLQFERRQIDRWPVNGPATAFEVAGEHFGRCHPLRLLDYSMQGFAASSDTMIAPGTVVTVGFQMPGYLAQRGTVVRCTPMGDGYRVAVVFERRLAA